MTTPHPEIWFFVLLIVIGFGLAGCEPSSQPSPKKNREPVSGEAILPEQLLPDLIQRAQSGDNEAAETLFVHYSNLGHKDEGRRWLELAARRGRCNSLEVLLYELRVDRAATGEIKKWESVADSFSCPFRQPQ